MASEETIEHILVTRGFLSDAQLLKVQEAKEQLGGTLEEIILSMELLTVEEYHRVQTISDALEAEYRDEGGASSGASFSEQDSPYQAVLPKLPPSMPVLPDLPPLGAELSFEDPLDGLGIPVDPITPPGSYESTAVRATPTPDDFGMEDTPEPGMLSAAGGLPRISTSSTTSGPAAEEEPAAVLPRLPLEEAPARIQQMMKVLEDVEFDESLAETMAPGLPPASEHNTSPDSSTLMRAVLETEDMDSATAPSTRPGTQRPGPQLAPQDAHGEDNCYSCGHPFEKRPVLCSKCRAFLKASPRNDRLIGQLLGGRFLLHGRLGAGGMGLVYHATDQQTKEFVACKILPIQLSTDDSTIQRFNLEAKVMLDLDHPNIVRAIDFGFEEDLGCYLAMELLVGEEFKDFVQAHRILSPPDVVEAFSQLCDAMEYSHSKGVVHRDLKPSNVFLMESDKGPLGHVKVIDFGIARLTADDMPRHTVTGTFLGTPQYMSPEQAAAKSDLDHRSDVYSLGVMLFECLVGRLPFVGEHIAQVLMHQLYMQPPTLTELRPEMAFPEQLQGFIDELLSKEPDGRPASMVHFKRGLLRALEGTSEESWGEAVVTAKVDDPVISQKLVEAANALLDECALPALDTSLTPEELFARLAERLRTPPSEVISVGEIAVLMLSEEIVEDEALELVTTAPQASFTASAAPVVSPLSVVGRMAPVAVPAKDVAHQTSAPHIKKRTTKKVAPVDASVRAAEAAFAQSQKRKFLFMLVFASLFFGLLVAVLWVAKG